MKVSMRDGIQNGRLGTSYLGVVTMSTVMLMACGTSKPTVVQTAAVLVEPNSAAQARTIADQYCGRCHNGQRETASALALKVFDTSRDNWWTPMSVDQRKEFLIRLAGKRGPTKKTPASTDEVQTLSRFFDTIAKIGPETPEPHETTP